VLYACTEPAGLSSSCTGLVYSLDVGMLWVASECTVGVCRRYGTVGRSQGRINR